MASITEDTVVKFAVDNTYPDQDLSSTYPDGQITFRPNSKQILLGQTTISEPQDLSLSIPLEIGSSADVHENEVDVSSGLIAIGEQAQAQNDSIAIGKDVDATISGSTMIGHSLHPNHSMGYSTLLGYQVSIDKGNSEVALNPSVALGARIAAGGGVNIGCALNSSDTRNSVIIGSNSSVQVETADFATYDCRGCVVIGDSNNMTCRGSSVVVGNSNRVTAQQDAVIVGQSNTYWEGRESVLVGSDLDTRGYANVVIGRASFAGEGSSYVRESVAIGYGARCWLNESIAIGHGVTPVSEGAIVLGKFNSIENTDWVFAIGDGVSGSDGHNVMEVTGTTIRLYDGEDCLDIAQALEESGPVWEIIQ